MIECNHQRGTTKLVEIILERKSCVEHGKICDAVRPLIRRFRLTNICERFYVGSCTAYGTQGFFKYDTTSKSHGQFEAYVKIVNLCVYIDKIGMSHSLHSTAKKRVLASNSNFLTNRGLRRVKHCR